jgi:hypothetical protein
MLTESVTRFMEDNAHKAPFAKDSPNPKEKLAAYLMGRWKNGMCQSKPSCVSVYLCTDVINYQELLSI